MSGLVSGRKKKRKGYINFSCVECGGGEKNGFLLPFLQSSLFSFESSFPPCATSRKISGAAKVISLSLILCWFALFARLEYK